jgi:hypothetical protein
MEPNRVPGHGCRNIPRCNVQPDFYLFFDVEGVKSDIDAANDNGREGINHLIICMARLRIEIGTADV